MAERRTQDKSIEDIFRNNLKIESNPMSIETLFTGRLRNRITYDPYYQRNYVWDKQKATYFIESILLGTEIPPLIFFNDGGQIEVIDGRQRFQTIDRFMTGEFELVRSGLVSIKSLAGKSYDKLDDEIRNAFLDTALRVIEFSIVASHDINELQEDLIKKEVFRRYNSGITPLRKSEIERAEYIEDPVTNYFRDQFASCRSEYEDVVHILVSQSKQGRLDDPRLLDEVMIDIRKLLVLPDVPISYYQSSAGKEVAKLIYGELSENAEPSEVYDQFQTKMSILKRLKTCVSTKNPANNWYLYETLYWALSIMEKEKIDLSAAGDDCFIERLSGFVTGHSHIYDAESQLFRAVTIGRFEATLSFFGSAFERTNLSDIYVNNARKISVNQYRNDEDVLEKISDFTSHRLNKPDAQTITVENLSTRMNRRRFMVRPAYQRYEVASTVKASAIIESMLLGIKLPPIFVFNRKDGVMEVIDGQQRILAILAFMDREFLDELGEWSRSTKNGFKLRNLRILKELNGKTFEDLVRPLQDKLWDFNLYQVNIDEKINPDFEPVDLFVRLNNKPYPIKDNTFEMWNSYIDRSIIQRIKDNTERHKEWFYLRNDNKRMDNENLYTALAYLEYHYADCQQSENVLEFYPRSNRVNSRIRSTVQITRLLELVSQDGKEREKFIKGIKATESFIRRKVKPLLIDKNLTQDEDRHLNKELGFLFDTERRTRNQFYVLWYVLCRINPSMIVEHRDRLKGRIFQVMRFISNTDDVSEENVIPTFHRLVSGILEDHGMDARKLKLRQEEISSRILSQNNECPLCSKPMYIGDDVEVDHKRPLSVGGSDTLDNIQIVHWICNRKKGNQVL
ncbi:MAG: DUF262 domain-containing protein [Chloroflexi bacterium]|nr:DUF262 domain-containing protein [Chloroflexota bacterium]